MRRCAALWLAALLAATGAAAQRYPDRPIRIVVAFAPGGAVDIVTRTVGQKIGEQVGQPVVVDNRPGGNANIGATMVARATPDGYTLLTASGANVVNMTLFPDLPYDALRDFAPISQIGFGPQVVIVNTSLPVKSVSDLLALARAKPGQLSYASGGVGTSQHLTGELFKSVGQVDILHVPYKGGAPALVDIIGGRVAFMFINTLEALPHAKAGKVRILAIANAKRSAVFPDTPTFAESGMPNFESVTWWGLVAPAGTPKAVIARLHAETVKALGTPEVKERFAALGAEILASTPEQFGAFMRAEAKKWGTVIKSTGIKAE